MPSLTIRALLLGAAVQIFFPFAFNSVTLAQQGQEAPPSQVGVVLIAPENLPVLSELPGRITPTRIAEVRPRVGGIVERRVFEQGSTVKAGDVLFELDKASYAVAVEAARAGVARAEAGVVEATRNEARLSTLNDRNITSRAQYDTALAAKLQAEAALAETKAQLRAAEINLGYADVTAPIDGRVGAARVTEGALVNAQGEVMTTIQNLDTVYADIQQPVSELLRLRNALDSGAIEQVEPDAAKVTLYLDDGTAYEHAGKLLFAETTVERSSGQVTLRAEFPNPRGLLLPGMYVRVTVEQATEQDVLAIPDQAVQRSGGGITSVYVVDSSGKAQLRPVRLGRTMGPRVTVYDGLNAGDMVVADGFQKIAPGAPVQPVCWHPVTEDAPPATCTKLLSDTQPATQGEG